VNSSLRGGTRFCGACLRHGRLRFGVPGPDADTRLICAELLHLGGEITAPGPTAAPWLTSRLSTIWPREVGAHTGGRAGRGEGVAELHAAMHAWEAQQMYLNLASTSRDPASL